MKKTTSTTLIVTLLMLSGIAKAQLGGLGKQLLDKGTDLASAGAVNKLLKQRAPIETSFKDVDRSGSKPPSFQEGMSAQPLYKLPKAKGGGFLLCAGLFEMVNKSYCLHAGTRGPSKGDGYMLAPVIGLKKDVVISILKNAEKHPEVEQHDIQVLLWAIVSRTKFSDFSPKIKLTATTLLGTADLVKLEGGALGILPFNIVEKAKEKLPEPLQKAFEAENNIRRLAASGNASYEEMEKYAVLAGIAPELNAEVPSGIWTLHPEGYYIRYFPRGYSITRVQVYVPQELIDKWNAKSATLVYDAPNYIACPANVGSQRLAQTNEPLEADYSKKLSSKCFTASN